MSPDETRRNSTKLDATDPEAVPIQFREWRVITTLEWPERTAFTEAFLKRPRFHHFIRDADHVTFIVANGTATYKLRRDLPLLRGLVIADLEDGSTQDELAKTAEPLLALDERYAELTER